jgi:hypothetical protein
MARPLTPACLTLALTLSVVLGVPASGAAQTDAVVAAPSIVFVFDGSGARISGERVRRAVATALHQNVVRLTDGAASSAAATLTVAFESPDRWVLDIVRGETHVARQVRLRTPTVGSLARVVIALVRDTEAPPVRPRTTSVRRDDEWIATIGDEILDPFGNLPVTAYRGRGVVDELVDPFGNGATTIASSRRRDGVIDPWAR